MKIVVKGGKKSLIFGSVILANCIRDGSCREKLVPTSSNESNIQEAAVNSAHRYAL